MKFHGSVAIWALFAIWTPTSFGHEHHCHSHGPFPRISDSSHATPAAARFFYDYYTAKSSRNPVKWGSFFHATQTVYSDATLGETFPNRTALDAALKYVTSFFKPDSPAYPLAVLGNTESAVVYSVDTPGLFGAEIRILSVFQFRDGKISRSTDYWDGRRNPVINGRPPLDQYPYDLGASTVKDTSDPTMQRVVRQLGGALSRGDANASAALFAADAVFVDLTLRTRIEGRLAIVRYLQRAIAQLPYGTHATVRRIIGTAQGGGYEWKTARQDVFNGITALTLDDCGAITQLSTVWDASRVSDAAVTVLAGLAIEP